MLFSQLKIQSVKPEFFSLLIGAKRLKKLNCRLENGRLARFSGLNLLERHHFNHNVSPPRAPPKKKFRVRRKNFLFAQKLFECHNVAQIRRQPAPTPRRWEGRGPSTGGPAVFHSKFSPSVDSVGGEGVAPPPCFGREAVPSPFGTEAPRVFEPDFLQHPAQNFRRLG